MNLVETLLEANSRATVNKIIRYVGNSPLRYAELVNVFLKGPYRVTQRAARPLSYCTELHPSLIEPHLRKIVAVLARPGQHKPIKRNVVRLLQFIDIPKRLRGRVATICFAFLADPGEAVAIRVFSMSVLANIAEHQPELCRELSILITDQLPYATAGFASRARKVMKRIEKK